MARSVVIMGATGRDFHNFNVLFREDSQYKVVAFTTPQSLFLPGRSYPQPLAGRLYPNGIPIVSEEQLESLLDEEKVSDVYFAYSDISHENVMHKASIAQSKGASFHLLGPADTMLPTNKPVIAVVASRGGAGKSTIARKVVDILRRQGLRPVVVRHPMPRTDMAFGVQRFENPEDLDRYHVAMEEREEYEGHIDRGVAVFSGVDYAAVLEAAEREADVIIWDGGENDFSFYKPTINIVVVDAVRQGHESRYYPGETNVRMADIVVVNKVNIATQEDVEKTVQNCSKLNPGVKIVRMRSEPVLDRPEWVRGRRVLVVEHGPSITKGEFTLGPGALAAKAVEAVLVDPRAGALGTIRSAYERYPNVGMVLPAFGYSGSQLKELEDSINAVECDAVVFATPADLTKLIRIGKPVARVKFEGFDIGGSSLEESVNQKMEALRSKTTA